MEQFSLEYLNSKIGNYHSLRLILENEPKNLVLPDK